MTGNEFIEELKKHPNLELPICISVDYDPRYPFKRVFAEEFLEIIENDPACIPILLAGYSNNDKELAE